MDVTISGGNKLLYRRRVRLTIPTQFHMAHALAAALQQASGIGQRRAVKEADGGVSRESRDVSKGDLSNAGGGNPVMQGFGRVGTCVPQPDEPSFGKRTKRISLRKPGCNRSIV